MPLLAGYGMLFSCYIVHIDELYLQSTSIFYHRILSRYLIKNSCTWYNNLYQYLNLFEVVGLPWLPKDYELANDLKSWLSIPWIDELTPRHVKR